MLESANTPEKLLSAARQLDLGLTLERPLLDLLPYVRREQRKALEQIVESAPPHAKTIGGALSGDWLVSWLRKNPGAQHFLLLGFRDLLLDASLPEPGPASSPAPRDDAALLAWAEARDVRDMIEQLVRIASDAEFSMWSYSAARVRASDLLLGRGAAFHALGADLGLHAIRRAQRDLWARLETTSAQRSELRAGEATQLAALSAPSAPDARAFFDWLLRAHAAVRARHPPEIEAAEELGVTATSLSPPVVRVYDRGNWAQRSIELFLGVEDPEDLRVCCTICAPDHQPHAPCIHAANAIRALAIMVSSSMVGGFEAILTARARPSWERFLEEALPPSPRDKNEVSIGFRLIPGERRGQLSLELLATSISARGTIKTKRASAEKVRELLEDEGVTEEVRRAVELLLIDHCAQDAASWTRWRPRPETVHQALLGLVGHPFVFSRPEKTDLPIRVELAPPRLRVERDAAGRTTFGARLGEREVSAPELVHTLKHSTAGGVYADLDERAGVVRVGRVPADLVRLVRRLDLGVMRAPAEATEALLRRLEPLESKGIIERSDDVKGRRVDASRELIFRMIPEPDVRLTVELRVRPIPGGPSFVAGDGPAEVYGRDAQDHVFHAVRDLDGERTAASALAAEALLTEAQASFSWSLADEAAARFLAWLESEAARVQVEWERERWRLSRPSTAKDLKLAIQRERDWFNVSGHLDVDGVRIDLAVLLEAARQEKRFVVASAGNWIPLSQALREQIEQLGDFATRDENGIALNPLAVPVVRELAEEAEVAAEPAWRDLEDRFAQADAVVPALPEDLAADLRPYQREGFEWMARLSAWGVGACLADDMGLGKTVQALAIILARSHAGPTIVVAPTSVCFNWQREAARFAPGLSATVYAEVPREERAATITRQGPRDLLIVSYGLLLLDRARFAGRRFTTLVLDEAQAIKNSETQRAQAVQSLDVDWALALSGTPIENHLGELWSLMRRLIPGLLGPQEYFKNRFALPIERKDAQASRALARLIRPFVLRRTKAEVASDLPPRTDILVEVELDARHRQLYEDARLAAIAQIAIPAAGPEREQSRFQMLAALTRLRQLACHPKLVEPESTLGSQKLERLLELVTTLVDEGHQALVFSQFVRHLDLVEPALAAAGIASVRLDGSTSAAERARRVDAFQEGKAKVFLLSLKAGGTGLNLTAADYVLHLDPWWNPAAEDQATDRAHRIGQQRPVTVYRLISRDTVESKILALHAEKRELVESLLSGTDTAGKLSLEQLADLMRGSGSEPIDEGTPSTPPSQARPKALLSAPPASEPSPASPSEPSPPSVSQPASEPSPPSVPQPASELASEREPAALPAGGLSFKKLAIEFAGFLEAEREIFAISDLELGRWKEHAQRFADFAEAERADPRTADIPTLLRGYAQVRDRKRKLRTSEPVALEEFAEFIGSLRSSDQGEPSSRP